ncbi:MULTISPECIES: PLDc N-terminal domain-containing protein [Spirosoma]|uniref:PLDc N-terminal domain-containing protein n=1 Tax=Spirosoma TaxID=107 RepID=UPI00338DE08B
MLSPDSALLLWQIIILIQLLGLVYSIVRLYNHRLGFRTKTVWCFIILCVPLGWVVYLIFRKPTYSTGD